MSVLAKFLTVADLSQGSKYQLRVILAHLCSQRDSLSGEVNGLKRRNAGLIGEQGNLAGTAARLRRQNRALGEEKAASARRSVGLKSRLDNALLLCKQRLGRIVKLERGKSGLEGRNASLVEVRRTLEREKSGLEAEKVALRRNIMSFRIQLCLEQNVCTFKATGKKFAVQRWWHCRTCGMDAEGGEGVCVVCKDVCHAGHDLVEAPQSPSAFYCDCSQRRGCKLRRRPLVDPAKKRVTLPRPEDIEGSIVDSDIMNLKRGRQDAVDVLVASGDDALQGVALCRSGWAVKLIGSNSEDSDEDSLGSLLCSWCLLGRDGDPPPASISLSCSLQGIQQESLLSILLGGPLASIAAADLFSYYSLFSDLGLARLGRLVCQEVKKIANMDALLSLAKSCPYSPGSEMPLFQGTLIRCVKQFYDECIEDDGVLRRLLETGYLGLLLRNKDPFWTTKTPSDSDVEALSTEELFRERCEKLYESRENPNVTLKTEDGDSEAAHLEILLSRSLFFTKMLSFRGREAEEVASQRSITLECFSGLEMRVLLRWIYTRTLRTSTDAFVSLPTVMNLLVHSETYGEKHLSSRLQAEMAFAIQQLDFDALSLRLLEVGHRVNKLPEDLRTWFVKECGRRLECVSVQGKSFVKEMLQFSSRVKLASDSDGGSSGTSGGSRKRTRGGSADANVIVVDDDSDSEGDGEDEVEVPSRRRRRKRRKVAPANEGE